MSERILDDSASGTLTIGDLTVRRLGFGAMRVSGARNAEGVRDRDEAITAVPPGLRPGRQLLRHRQHLRLRRVRGDPRRGAAPVPRRPGHRDQGRLPAGQDRAGQDLAAAARRPEHIKEECDKSLARLRVDVIDLYQVHVPDPTCRTRTPSAPSSSSSRRARCATSASPTSTLEQLAVARSLCEVVSVQNAYNVGQRTPRDVLQACEEHGIAFIPHSPNILQGAPRRAVVAEIAAAHGASAQQVASRGCSRTRR